MKYYSAFGHALASDLDLPELEAQASSNAPIDVLIRVVDDRIDANAERFAQYSDLQVFTVSNESFGFRVSFGRLIEVWIRNPGDTEIVRPLLLGPMLTVALHQLRLWPLHVGALRVGGQAWLLAGPSGAGKSTLVTYVSRRFGFGPVTDDAGVMFETEQGLTFAGASRAFRLTTESYGRLFAGEEQSDTCVPNPLDNKIRVRMKTASIDAIRLPVAGLVRVSDLQDQSAGQVRLARLTGFRAVEVVRAALFQPFAGHRLRSAAETLQFCTRVARNLPIYELQRVRDLDMLSVVGACLNELFVDQSAHCTTSRLEIQK